MSATGTGRAKDSNQLSGNYEYRSGILSRATEGAAKRAGYGLPCANCGTYYAADESACPICKFEKARHLGQYTWCKSCRRE